MPLCSSLSSVSLAQSHPGRACQCRVFQVLCFVSPAADASAFARRCVCECVGCVCTYTLPVLQARLFEGSRLSSEAPGPECSPRHALFQPDIHHACIPFTIALICKSLIQLSSCESCSKKRLHTAQLTPLQHSCVLNPMAQVEERRCCSLCLLCCSTVQSTLSCEL
jgi:hypothetical protein